MVAFRNCSTYLGGVLVFRCHRTRRGRGERWHLVPRRHHCNTTYQIRFLGRRTPHLRRLRGLADRPTSRVNANATFTVAVRATDCARSAGRSCGSFRPARFLFLHRHTTAGPGIPLTLRVVPSSVMRALSTVASRWFRLQAIVVLSGTMVFVPICLGVS